MKILTPLTALLLACFTFRSDAADATIANAPGGGITTVPDAYRMPWENPAVQGYYITFANLTNQVLAGMANQSYANSAASAATNGYPWTNLPAISIAASNVTSGGVLPAGTVSSTALTSGYALGNNGSVRIWTNMLNGVSIGGNAVSATTAGSATNVVGGTVSATTGFYSGNNTNRGISKFGSAEQANIDASGQASFAKVTSGGSVLGVGALFSSQVTFGNTYYINSAANKIFFAKQSDDSAFQGIFSFGLNVTPSATIGGFQPTVGSPPSISVVSQTTNTCDFKVSGTLTATNGFGVLKTNAAPSNVTIGVTAPDYWICSTNTAGVQMFTPAWANH